MYLPILVSASIGIKIEHRLPYAQKWRRKQVYWFQLLVAHLWHGLVQIPHWHGDNVYPSYDSGCYLVLRICIFSCEAACKSYLSGKLYIELLTSNTNIQYYITFDCILFIQNYIMGNIGWKSNSSNQQEHHGLLTRTTIKSKWYHPPK